MTPHSRVPPRWWVRGDHRENGTQIALRYDEFLRELQYETLAGGATSPLVVGHSLFARGLFERFLSDAFEERHPDAARALKKRKLRNCGLVAVEFLFDDSTDAAPVVADARLLFKSRLEPPKDAEKPEPKDDAAAGPASSKKQLDVKAVKDRAAKSASFFADAVKKSARNVHAAASEAHAKETPKLKQMFQKYNTKLKSTFAKANAASSDDRASPSNQSSPPPPPPPLPVRDDPVHDDDDDDDELTYTGPNATPPGTYHKQDEYRDLPPPGPDLTTL